MADLLQDRKADDPPIFRAHIERVLKDHAKKMDEAQNKGYSGFKDPSFHGRSFQTDGETLEYTQSALYRFVDMKKLRGKRSGKQYERNKVYDFHNRIIMGHYNGIMKDGIYGMAEEVKQDLRNTVENISV